MKFTTSDTVKRLDSILLVGKIGSSLIIAAIIIIVPMLALGCAKMIREFLSLINAKCDWFLLLVIAVLAMVLIALPGHMIKLLSDLIFIPMK